MSTVGASRVTSATSKRSNRVRLLAAGLATLCAASLAHVGSKAHAAGRPAIGVPAYFWTGADWSTITQANANLQFIVLNPSSGPGSVKYQQFATSVTASKAAGKTVLGYVHTDYGTRPIAEVKADVDRYRLWYGINTFFFDQTPYNCDNLSYYTGLHTYVHAQAGAMMVINPGVNPLECYTAVAEGMVNFEGTEGQYAAWSPASYAASYPNIKFWHLVYGVDATHGQSIMDDAATKGASILYLTDDIMPNPWDRLPYESLLNDQLGIPNPTTTTTSTTSTTTTTTTTTAAPTTTLVPTSTIVVATTPRTPVSTAAPTSSAPQTTTASQPLVPNNPDSPQSPDADNSFYVTTTVSPTTTTPRTTPTAPVTTVTTKALGPTTEPGQVGVARSVTYNRKEYEATVTPSTGIPKALALVSDKPKGKKVAKKVKTKRALIR